MGEYEQGQGRGPESRLGRTEGQNSKAQSSRGEAGGRIEGVGSGEGRNDQTNEMIKRMFQDLVCDVLKGIPRISRGRRVDGCDAL